MGGTTTLHIQVGEQLVSMLAVLQC
jgi:hypothetical protein